MQVPQGKDEVGLIRKEGTPLTVAGTLALFLSFIQHVAATSLAKRKSRESLVRNFTCTISG